MATLLHPSRLTSYKPFVKGYYALIIKILKVLQLDEILLKSMFYDIYFPKGLTDKYLSECFISHICNAYKKMPIRFSSDCKNWLKKECKYHELQRFDVLRRALFEYYTFCNSSRPLQCINQHKINLVNVFDDYPIPNLLKDIEEQGIVFVITKFLPNYKSIAEKQEQNLHN